MKIKVGLHYESLIDSEDYVLVGDIKWRAIIAPTNGKIYAYHPKHGMMSRMIMQTPHDLQCDHKNGDTLDNRKRNLRNCTASQNQMNQPKYIGKSSKFKGVSWYPNQEKWRARINYEGKTILLGYFVSEEDAAQAYNFKATELYGEFAVLNQIFGGGETGDDDDVEG